MHDKITGRPRGFGFAVFSDPSVLDSVLQDRHTIDGRNVEAKRALSREEQQATRPGSNVNRSSTVTFRTKKIFVGGLPSTLTEEQFCQYFETYGDVTDVVIMFDQTTNRPRGFGFISFDTEDSVDRVLQKTVHEVKNKLVEVKRALPKVNNVGSGSGSFDSQNSGGGYTVYSGYSQPSYGGYGGPSQLKNPWSGYGAGNVIWNGGYGSSNDGYNLNSGGYGYNGQFG